MGNDSPSPVFAQSAPAGFALPDKSVELLDLIAGARSVRRVSRNDGAALWANEARHRAANLAQLAAALTRLEQRDPGRFLGVDMAGRAARLRDCYTQLGDRAGGVTIASCDQLLRELTESLIGLFDPVLGDVRHEVRVEPVALDPDERRALLLIANELILNALKHAFPTDRAGTITVELHSGRTGDHVLIVADDGVGRGLPKNRRLGQGLVIGLASLLDATVERPFREYGTMTVVRLPARPIGGRGLFTINGDVR